MSLLGAIVNTFLPLVPRPIVGKLAQRYVAGATLPEALETVRRLNEVNASATVDILGESVRDEQAATAAVNEYIALAQAISSSGVDSTVSVKSTMIGLAISEELCVANMRRIYAKAKELGVFVTIDMESSGTTDSTLDIFEDMREEFGNVGCVLQAYLRRTIRDARSLPRGCNVRLCKGIYVETPESAYQSYQEIRGNYLQVLRLLFEQGHYVGIATHDDWLIDRALGIIEQLGIGKDGYEFQMLLGVREPLRFSLLDAGHRLRVYVPFGRDWYAYSVRRVRENPNMAWTILKAAILRR